MEKESWAPAVQAGSSPAFTKDQLAASKRYAAQRDLLNALLEDDRQYTLDEVDQKIEAFRKGKVK